MTTTITPHPSTPRMQSLSSAGRTSESFVTLQIKTNVSRPLVRRQAVKSVATLATRPGGAVKDARWYPEPLQALQFPQLKPFREVRDGGAAVWGQRFAHDDEGLAERDIRVIATDVDGTLLDSRQQLSERTETALLLAQEHGVKVVLATGKARGPWVADVMSRLNLDTPGVFLQGLMVYSANGEVLYERRMGDDVARQVIKFAEVEGITLTAYCGDRILCERTNAHTDRLIGYGEPTPEAVGPLRSIVGVVPIHKLILMADDSVLAALRPHLDYELKGRATLVTALHGMLEVLPVGASKAAGLSFVLDLLAVQPHHVMAAGDGENDIEMLQMAGLGVAMGNAGAAVRAVADYVTVQNDRDGLAVAVERFALPAGVWCWD